MCVCVCEGERERECVLGISVCLLALACESAYVCACGRACMCVRSCVHVCVCVLASGQYNVCGHAYFCGPLNGRMVGTGGWCKL